MKRRNMSDKNKTHEIERTEQNEPMNLRKTQEKRKRNMYGRRN